MISIFKNIKLISRIFFSLLVKSIIFCFLIQGCKEKNTAKIPVIKDNIQTTKISSQIFTDSRDGQSYSWVELKDGKKWMSQNLNYKTADTWCYDDSEWKCKEYGRLYSWEAALKACPKGWHLPSDKEWRTMAKYYGGCDEDAKDYGKAAYKALILNGNTRFSARKGGYHTPSGYYNHIKHGLYWSSTERDAANAYDYAFSSDFGAKLSRNNTDKSWGKSCRCIED